MSRLAWDLKKGILVSEIVSIIFISFILLTRLSWAATYYIRTDGGTADQCSGTVDAPYPGSGTNQSCGWAHPFWALDSNGNWKIQGGDTLLIYSGSYQMGFGSPNTGWCSTESTWDCYLPSASVLKYARAKNKGNRGDLFAVGNPATGLSPLPAAEVEVKEVSAIFEKKLVLTGQQATKISVKSQGPQYDMILLSTHGEMIESDPLKSNLRFTPSEKDDGRLTVSEVFDMEIKANLVTLSACETALVRGETGDFPQGDDLVGLSRAFIHAGAPSVVASLWKVSDDSTVELMRAFYRNLKSMPKPEALRKAQLDLMKSSIRFHVERGSGGITQPINYHPDMSIECSHPFFWAPFILLGDWR